MKENFSYRVQKLEPNGHAVVEYEHPQLGTVIAFMILPLDRGEVAVRHKIIEGFPHESFYSNRLAANPVETQLISGTISIDLDDYFYSVMDETTSNPKV